MYRKSNFSWPACKEGLEEYDADHSCLSSLHTKHAFNTAAKPAQCMQNRIQEHRLNNFRLDLRYLGRILAWYHVHGKARQGTKHRDFQSCRKATKHVWPSESVACVGSAMPIEWRMVGCQKTSYMVNFISCSIPVGRPNLR